jgi:hypothetical protein
LLQLSTIQVHRMPYFGNTLLNPSNFLAIKHNSSTRMPSFCFKIIIGKQKVHRKVSVITMKVLKFIKTYCQNMAWGVLELCLIAIWCTQWRICWHSNTKYCHLIYMIFLICFVTYFIIMIQLFLIFFSYFFIMVCCSSRLTLAKSNWVY